MIQGKVVLVDEGGGIVHEFYPGGDAVRSEWLDELSLKVIVWTTDGMIRLLDRDGRVEVMI